MKFFIAVLAVLALIASSTAVPSGADPYSDLTLNGSYENLIFPNSITKL